ncbi:hypothetical protein PPACK8108_LOCUS2703 [Phakopsora pachyrhizi]|uniref:Uncharacterized protein n=1 Tax=Phakopsora pachyrhizi TaxID=170000 RepID=A0AAV0AJQ6_PHAPC|nr:hypothetical protein PPACK8108_LOCUS2703 [Phakopsora pachyrhizi]
MSCKPGKATKAPFDLWQEEHTIVTEDKPKAEVNNFKDDDINETDEDGEPVQIPIVKPLCAVAHIDLNYTVEDDPINIVIKIENLTATFIVSSGSGGENKEDHLQAVLVDEPTQVGGLPGIFSTSAADLFTPSSQSTSTITTTRTSNAASGSCNATTINSITTTTTNNRNKNTMAMTPAATTTTPDTSAAAAAQQQLGPLTYPTGGRRQDAGWDNPAEPYLHKPDIQPECDQYSWWWDYQQ